MKKLIISSACALVVASSFAQGNVNWGSISFTAVTAQTNSTQYSPLFGGGATGSGAIGNAGGSASLGTGFYYELLVGSVYTGAPQATPTTLAGLSAWADSGLSATNSNNAGRLQVINANQGATVAQMSTSLSNNIMLVGWSANLGSTWATAYANMQNASFLAGLSSQAFFGMSAIGFMEALSTQTSPGSTIFGQNANAQGQPIFSLNTPLFLIPVVPEPGTMALAALGGASLLLFRRKK